MGCDSQCRASDSFGNGLFVEVYFYELIRNRICRPDNRRYRELSPACDAEQEWMRLVVLSRRPTRSVVQQKTVDDRGNLRRGRDRLFREPKQPFRAPLHETGTHLHIVCKCDRVCNSAIEIAAFHPMEFRGIRDA